MEEQFKKALSNPDNLPTILNNIWNMFEALRLGYKLEGPISQRAFEGVQMNENSNDEVDDQYEDHLDGTDRLRVMHVEHLDENVSPTKELSISSSQAKSSAERKPSSSMKTNELFDPLKFMQEGTITMFGDGKPLDSFFWVLNKLHDKLDFEYSLNDMVIAIRTIILNNPNLYWLVKDGNMDRYYTIEKFAQGLTSMFITNDLNEKNGFELKVDKLLWPTGMQMHGKYSEIINNKINPPDPFKIHARGLTEDFMHEVEDIFRSMDNPIVYIKNKVIMIVYLDEIIALEYNEKANDQSRVKILFNESSLVCTDHIEYKLKHGYVDKDEPTIIHPKFHKIPSIKTTIVKDVLESKYDQSRYVPLNSCDLLSELTSCLKCKSDERINIMEKAARKISNLYEDEKWSHDFDNNMIWSAIESVFYDIHAMDKSAEDFAYPNGDVHAYDDYNSEGYHIHSDGETSECFSYGARLVDTSYHAYALKEELMEKYNFTEYDLFMALHMAY